MHIKTRGIVLSTVKYSETSVIVRIFTERLGVVSYIVNGVRTARGAARAAMLRPLNLLDLDILHREQRNLQRLKDYKRAYHFITIPFDTFRSAAATLIVEVVSNAMREHDPQPEIFEYVYRSFIHLDELEILNNDFHLQFMLRFTHYLGFAPQGDCTGTTIRFDMESGCYVDEGAIGRYILDTTQSQQLYLIDQTDVDTSLAIPLHRSERQRMLHSLLLYYRLHLEGFRELKSPAIWREVFDGV